MSEFKSLIASLHGSPIEVFLPSTNLCNRFVERAYHLPNKIAVVLDDQSVTYGELYSLVNSLACRLSHIVQPGDVVCQCVERSIEMVVGILAIFMCNTVYCPLSPYDPNQRHRTLLNETHAKVILVHNATAHLFIDNDDVSMLRIDQDDRNDSFTVDRAVDDLSAIAFIVFTSGSTGIPKGVPIGHTHFAYYLASMCYERYILHSDILLQVSRDTFDAHLQEILGAVLVGGTCVLLCPSSGTHLNVAYLLKIMRNHHATFINLVPSLSIALVDYLSSPKQLLSSFLRVVISTGEPLPRILAGELLACLSAHTQLLNTYGVTETTVDCTYRRVFDTDVLPSVSTAFVPIGLPLPNYICHIVVEEDEQQDGIGELYIGGPCVFQGYLNHGTNPANSRLMEIEGKMCYRTGDLVKIVNDELAYVGRRDFQVKIRGQRIETGEIEATILRECRKQLNACLVVAKDDRLIAYVQTREPDLVVEQHIKEICRQFLPSSMTLFAAVVLDRFPLNSNGKIDRARLSLPESQVPALSVNDTPQTELELELQTFWCRLLKTDNIARDVNLLTLGANSLQFMLATNHYCRQWLFDQPQVDLSIFFRHTTISKHAQLIATYTQTAPTSTTLSCCPPHHLTEGPVSFAQESIWLDEQMRFQVENNSLTTYHMVYAFHVLSTDGESHLVVSRLRSSLQLVLEKHISLRSSLYMSNDHQSKLIQSICPLTSIDEFIVESWIKNDDDLFEIIADEETNRFHLDASKGRVFRCHLVRYSDLNSDDILILKFHHLVFDGTSETLFFNDLKEAYMTGQLASVHDETFTYLDYARWERTLDMSNALLFWKENLRDYQTFELPYDHRLLTKARTGRGSTVVLQDFDGNTLLAYAGRREVTLFQLCLAIYYTFLFKFTGSRDLIVGGLVANRMQARFNAIIGMFVNLVPYRFQIEPQETFQEVVRRVQHLCQDVVSHAYMPFQSISKLIELDNGISTTLDIETIEDRYSLDTNLELIQMSLPVRVTQFDLSLSFKHNLSKNMIDCSFDYSTDVFDISTIETLAKRFHSLVTQILCNDQRPIYEFSLLLEDEQKILCDLNPTTPIAQKTDCIHWAFTRRAQEHPQKIGIMMEDQSLSYGEILHYAQQIALYLFTHCQVRLGDIVCQLVERSIDMVLGILAIWMCGAIYTPFSPREPTARLQLRISSLEARLLLVHAATRLYMEQTPDVTIVELDRIGEQTNNLSVLDSVSVTSEHLSHIVFTSGSTGEPKMVQLRHRNFVSYIRACLFKPTDIVLQQASVAFDSHIEEIMGPLISSAQLAILKPDPYHLDIDYFSAAIARHQVTFLFPVPTLLIMLTNVVRSLPKDEQYNRLKSLRFLSCGGEKLYLVTVLDILPFLNVNCSIHNYYGPAECTLATLHYEVTCHEPQNSIGLPIGRPMANARVYILDEFLQKVPPGQMGEIVIGGDGVFAGYRNRDDLTRQVLIEHDGYVCYRTGDLGRLNTNNGQIEYLGRRDYQVKIRGQRIELDEIEHTIMRSSPNISNCLVIKATSGSVDHLVAYIENNDENYSTNESDIRQFCTENLSPFMVPSFFIVLDKFPLSQSGKIDRARLPLPKIANISKEENVAVSLMERQLCSIVAQALDVPDSSLLNINATFSQLGATSLGIVKVLALIRQQKLVGSYPVDISILLNNPSMRQVAQALESLNPSNREIVNGQPQLIDQRSSEKVTTHEYKTANRSLFIETLGIMVLIYVFVLPIYLALRTSLILAPVLHLLLYILFQKLLELPSTDEWHLVYSSVYYRWWFLQRLWKLNAPWHHMLLGTSLYNTYLRLCGAQIGRDVQLRTSLIDWPNLIDIGENSFVGEDVILSSMEYRDDNMFRLNFIQISAHCSIGARSVLHSKVHIANQVTVKPLTCISGTITAHSLVDGLEITTLKNDDRAKRVPIGMVSSLTCLIGVWIIHECLLLMAIFLGRSLLSLVCLFWLIECVLITLVILKWLLPQRECWWIRHLIVTAFAFGVPIIFDGPDPVAAENTYPRILRWLNRNRIGHNLRVAVITDLLDIRRFSVEIGSNVTLGADILFNDEDRDDYSITIQDGASLGNDCIIEAGAYIPHKTSVGSMTRVDLVPRFEQENQVIVGVPARQTALFVSSNDDNDKRLEPLPLSDFLIRSILIRVIALLFTLSTIHLTILPIWMFVFASIVCRLYSPVEDSSLLSCLSATLMNDFKLLVGPFLGGTQWLNIFLNTLGANIHPTAIIADIDCIDDPELITVDPYVHIDQRARVQAHTNEHRRLYMRPVSIGSHSHLMSGAFVLPGCNLGGNNIIHPCTLIMKGDQLPINTNWRGSPATYYHSSN